MFKAEEIMDIIKNPNKEKLERIISIDNLATIDLFRGAIISVSNTGTMDVSNRIVQVVNKRRSEIYRNPYAESVIKIKKTRTEIEAEAKEKAMEQVMADTIAKMKADMEAKFAKKLEEEVQLRLKENEENSSQDEDVQEAVEEKPPVKRGRPKGSINKK